MFALLAAVGTANAQQETSDRDDVWSRVQPFGDLRLREALDLNRQDASGEGLDARHRQRFRFRFGARVRVARELSIVTRLASGNPGDPRSTHQTFGEAAGGLSISLDQIYVRYEPRWLGGTQFTAGKLPYPFRRSPVYSELMFDADVQPTGVTLAYRSPGAVSVFGSVGEYLLIEHGVDEEVHATSLQLGSALELAGLSLTVAAIGMAYWNLDTAPVEKLLELNRGNATIDRNADGEPDAFAHNFALGEAFATLAYRLERWQLGGTGGVLGNLNAPLEEATGRYVGGFVEQRLDEFTWRAYGQYQYVGRESVLTALSQDDFLLPSAFRGVVAGAKVTPIRWLSLHLWSLSAASPQGRFQTRLRLDLNLRL